MNSKNGGSVGDSCASKMRSPLIVDAYGRETIICGLIILAFFGGLCATMGVKNMFSTMMNTAYSLVVDTSFYIMGVAVLTGALSGLMSEFGIIGLINKILAPLMKPLYKLPGASTLAIITTFLSDGPAVVSLGKDKDFIKYFTPRQKTVLVNLGTTFAMGLIVVSFMLGLAEDSSFIIAIVCGLIASCCASVISVRLMYRFSRKAVDTRWGKDADNLINIQSENDDGLSYNIMTERIKREGSMFNRVLGSLVDGGRTGVDLGLMIIPGNVIICTILMMLVKSPSANGFTGAAMEGVGLIPFLADQIHFLLQPLFGFVHSEAIAFPISCLGSTGASLSMIPGFLKDGIIGANEIAVFTAFGMTYSGYLSAHVAFMDALGCREMAGKAIAAHTIAGICAGIIAHWTFVLVTIFL